MGDTSCGAVKGAIDEEAGQPYGVAREDSSGSRGDYFSGRSLVEKSGFRGRGGIEECEVDDQFHSEAERRTSVLESARAITIVGALYHLGTARVDFFA